MTSTRTRRFNFGYLILVLTMFIISSCVKTPHKENIYGVWKGLSQGKELLFKFSNDGTCELRFKENVSGAIDTIKGSFEMVFSKKPIPLTIRNIPQLNHPLYTIVEFNGDGSIRIAYFASRWRLRPISFDSDKSMNLKRVANNLQ